MPLREKGEPLSHFIHRFVGNKHEEHEFPDIKQRLAVGYSEARKHARKYGGRVMGKKNMKQGGKYIVGEEGPEELHLEPGSKGFVVPNPNTAARMSHRQFGGLVGTPLGGPALGAPISFSPGFLGKPMIGAPVAATPAGNFYGRGMRPGGMLNGLGNPMQMRAEGGAVTGGMDASSVANSYTPEQQKSKVKERFAKARDCALKGGMQ